jgi:hypothetical protein
MFGSFLPSLWLVRTTKAYSGVGADIVMESITLTTDTFTRVPEQEWLQPKPLNR